MNNIFVITLHIIVKREQYEPYLPHHRAYLDTLKARGVLLLSGPFADRTGGMVVVRATTYEEADAIAQNDPLVRYRLDSYELRQWVITDGNVHDIERQS